MSGEPPCTGAICAGRVRAAAPDVRDELGPERFAPLGRRAQARAWLRALAGHLAPQAPAVKLCGLTCERDVDAALEAGADLLGFVSDVPASRRSVGPARLAELCARVHACASGSPAGPPWCVGVFVDEPVARLFALLGQGPDAVGPDIVQLHGHEDDAYIAELRRALGAVGEDVGIVQAFRIREPADVARANASAADMVLLDAGAGCGRAFDWSLAWLCTRPFFLAGGLGPCNLAQAAAQARPWGVDMSSGIETDGKKDSIKMKAVVRAARGGKGAYI